MSDSLAPCKLSDRDSAVLQYLFNPLMQSPIQVETAMESDKANNKITKEDDISSLDEETVKLVKSLEVQGVKAARNYEYQTAIQHFTDAIEMVPEYSSPYNNRAQVYRLIKEFGKAKDDLDKAIQYSNPDPTKEPFNTRVARLAYAQRGFLFKGFLNNEELGHKDLTRAAELGHSLASLETNPYRTLCGDMVSIMMKEQCGVNI